MNYSIIMAMASSCFFFLVLAIFSTTCWMADAGDPDLIVDFIAPPNDALNGSFFTFTGLRSAVFGQFPPTFKPTKATFLEFPALLGQSVSFAVLQFPAGAVNPPHTHPRSAELLFVLAGTLQVGFVDSTNKLFNQTLQLGDVFLFPKGLVHFQFNADPLNSATAIAAFGSANAGTVSVPLSVFTSGIRDDVLAKAFNTHVAVIRRIKHGLPN